MYLEALFILITKCVIFHSFVYLYNKYILLYFTLNIYIYTYTLNTF